MLLDRIKKITALLIFAAMTASVFAADTSALVKKQLTAAEDAMDEDDIETAYKKVNGALQMMNEDTTPSLRSSVVTEAKLIYQKKLELIVENYNGVALSDVKIMMEKYPDVKSTKIDKLLSQIEEDQKLAAENTRKAEAAAAEAAAQKRHDEEQSNIKQQTAALAKQNEALSKQAESNAELAESMKNQAESMRSQAEELAKSNQNSEKNLKAIQDGFMGMNDSLQAQADSLKEQAVALKESTKSQAKSTNILIFAIIGIGVLILLIVLVVTVFARRSMKMQQERQEQYMQAFRMIAENTSNTNRIMLGGVTDVYGNVGEPLKLAGASTWAPVQALPELDFTPEEEEEVKQLAVKCEEIGAKIDQITNRKNNSKNVSELVYKLSMRLGLSQGRAMLNFCAAMIYDAGFLGVDPEIWTAETLTDAQKDEMRNHVNIAEKYLDFVPKKFWDVFDQASRMHHENLDGTGYPKGLKDKEIPEIARLIRVAETFVSMSSRRNYRQPLDKETAIEKLKEQPQFYDTAVVDMLDQIV